MDMRKDSFLMLSVLVLTLGIGGCSKDDGNVVGDSREISFGITSVTRAVIDGENFADGSSFCVWGWRQLGTDGIPVNVFDKTPVTYSGGKWEYEGKRYWVPEYTYDFYAVYPEFPAAGAEGQTTAASVASNGAITVTGFDCSKTGTEAVDLMTASKTGIHYTEEQPVQPVPLVFSHELSRLKFTVMSEGSRVQIEQISIVNVGYKGTFISPDSWTVTEFSTESTPFSRTMFEVNPGETGVDVFGDILLLPATADQLKNAKLKLTYRYEYNGTTGKLLSKKISLATPAVQSWDKGQSYNYKLSIPVQSEDLKLNVTVLPWNKNEDASVEW